jgi:hypothetical protein
VFVLLLLGATSGCATVPKAALLCAELKGAGPGSDALDPEAGGSARLEVGGAWRDPRPAPAVRARGAVSIV